MGENNTQAIKGAPQDDVLIVDIGDAFLEEMGTMFDDDLDKIYGFIEHIRKNGFVGLEGRHKKSNDVPVNDPQFSSKTQRALKYKLWHYHIGMDKYEDGTAHGDRTSEWLLHYTYDVENRKVVVVDCTKHPPFELPADKYLHDDLESSNTE
jgi:hypothetical protein